MKKVKLSQDFTNSNKDLFPKGSVRTVTTKLALWMEKNKIAKIIIGKDDKEDDEAKGRDTK
jgi:hypothetical protein